MLNIIREEDLNKNSRVDWYGTSKYVDKGGKNCLAKNNQCHRAKSIVLIPEIFLIFTEHLKAGINRIEIVYFFIK